MNNRHTLWFALHVYMIIGMHYHNQQVPIHCGQRITKYRAKKRVCKAFSAELKKAFDIDTYLGMMSTFTLRCSACTVSSQCKEPSVPSQRECTTNVQ